MVLRTERFLTQSFTMFRVTKKYPYTASYIFLEKGENIMKKLFCAILSLFLLTGCGGSQPTAVSSSDAQGGKVSTPTPTNGDSGTVTVTLSSDFVDSLVKMSQIGDESATIESVYESIKESSPNAVLNDDNSITVPMSKTDYEKTLSGYKENVDRSIAEMIENPNEYSSITNITYNDDMSHFDITISGNEPTLYDSFIVIAFYMYGGMYSAFAGNKNSVITVDYRNSNNEIVASASSEDLKK